jgi:murein DD-endopeptidase MepM/ murein hydrolase activator NlpD
MGQSGNTTGVHLHFEVIKDKELIDPFVWLSQNG